MLFANGIAAYLETFVVEDRSIFWGLESFPRRSMERGVGERDGRGDGDEVDGDEGIDEVLHL